MKKTAEIYDCLKSKVLFNDSCNDSKRDAALFIYVGDGKRNIIFLAGHTAVVTGMRNGVDAVREANENNTFMNICNFPNVFALHTAFIKVVLPVLRNAFHIGFYGEAFNVAAIYC